MDHISSQTKAVNPPVSPIKAGRASRIPNNRHPGAMNGNTNKLRVSPSSLETAFQTKPHLARYATRLKQLDKDQNHELDLEEICEAVEELVAAEKQNRLLKWIAGIVAGLLILSIAAIAGLTFAVVELTKEVSTHNGVLADTNGNPLHTGEVTLGASSDPKYDEEMADWFESMNMYEFNGTTSAGTRRLLQVTTDNKNTGTGTTVNGECTYADSTSLKAWGRTEATAVTDTCDKINQGILGKYLLVYLRDDTCRSSDDNTQNATSGGQCKTYRTPIELTSESCAIITKPADQLCLANEKYYDKKGARWLAQYTILSGQDVRGYNYAINFKRNCDTGNWFESAGIMQFKCAGELPGFSQYGNDGDVDQSKVIGQAIAEANSTDPETRRRLQNVNVISAPIEIDIGYHGMKVRCTPEDGCSRV